MRQNPSFAMTDVGELRRLVNQHPWVTLVSDTPDGLVASHYAVMLDPARDDLTIVGHVGKPDDLIHGLGERELLVVVQGPHGYISPSWYGSVFSGPVASVPTWNFVSAHLTGVPELLDTDENLRVLDALVDRFESRMPEPRGMWQAPNDATFIERLERGTVGFRLTPSRVVAKRKLSQNRPGDVVETIIAELAEGGAHPNPPLAAEMRRARDAQIAAAKPAGTTPAATERTGGFPS